MKKPFRVFVKNLDGWWSAVCPELNVSGFGVSKDEAIIAVSRSMQSTLAAQAEAMKQSLQKRSTKQSAKQVEQWADVQQIAC